MSEEDQQDFTGDDGGDGGDYEHKPQKAMDAAFLYVLFTFQAFVCILGIYMFFAKLFGSKEYQKKKKVTAFKLCL